MSTRKAPSTALPESTIGLLLAIAGAEMVADALPLLRDRLALTPEKLALLLCRVLNPDEIMGEGEESLVRGVHPKTLKAKKDNRELPLVMQGGISCA